MTTRPSRHDEDVLERAAKRLLPRVMEWIARDGGTYDEGEICKQLTDAIKWEDDGYAIAKKLDYDGWLVDAELVEICDSASHYKYEAHVATVEKWVAENQGAKGDDQTD